MPRVIGGFEYDDGSSRIFCWNSSQEKTRMGVHATSAIEIKALTFTNQELVPAIKNLTFRFKKYNLYQEHPYTAIPALAALYAGRFCFKFHISSKFSCTSTAVNVLLQAAAIYVILQVFAVHLKLFMVFTFIYLNFACVHGWYWYAYGYLHMNIVPYIVVDVEEKMEYDAMLEKIELL
ncbi:hypothetical protein QVD17_16492 [Tagetes erecta]|uniref:Uncharacterized protein n=1 Tax=Tagetes erecta TaxID=13708 RepID=A0AAD8KWX2_TARER|nr:hypothetical protein QVD17_16492 [Tagetes erecta]